MSIVDAGILRFLYDNAKANIEYKSSEFWQHYLKQQFDDTRIYSVISEVPPDSSRRRVDIIVKRYDPDHHTMSAMLWVECKRPSGSAKEVEYQALDAAKRCIEADKLLLIYTMTTVGVFFRIWFYERGGGERLLYLSTGSGQPRTGRSISTLIRITPGYCHAALTW